MRVLGAVLAGGLSSRFGSDKALAPIRGGTLIEDVIATAARQCEDVLICGRDWPGLSSVPDRPARHMGPLGGLNAALHEGLARGYDVVLSFPCDTPGLPADLRERLFAAGLPSHVGRLPVIGLWPSILAQALDQHLAVAGKHSLRGWCEAVGSTAVELAAPILNVNHADDLARIAEQLHPVTKEPS